MGAHSVLGPSSAKRWMNCPASVSLCENAPKQETSFAAAEGTVAHSVAEDLVTGKTDVVKLTKRIGDTVMQDGHEIEIDEEMVDGAVLYRDTIHDDTLALERDGRPSPVIGKAERRICASSVDKDLWGTTDYSLYRRGHKLKVYDYKYGKGIAVEVHNNEQMLIYAIATMDDINCWAFEEVELCIIQPRKGHADGPIRRAVYPLSFLEDFQATLIGKVSSTRNPEAEVKAGDWCRWCAAKPMCPALYKKAQQMAKIDFSVIPAPTKAKDTTGLPPVELMPIEKMAEYLKWEAAFSAWFGAMKAHGQQLIEQGGDFPGWKLVEGRSNRKWGNEEEVIARYEGLFGEDVLYAPKKLKTPAQLEKVVGKKELAASGLVEKTTPGKSIAVDSDPRLVARSSAVDDFKVIGGEQDNPKNTSASRSLMEELQG